MHTAKLASAFGNSSLAGDGGMVGVKFHIARNEQVQQAIMVVVAPSRSSGPSSELHTGFLGHVRECPIMIVVEETVLSKIRNVDIRPAIIVIVAHGNPEAPALVGYARFVGDVGERAVVVVMKQHGARSCFLTFQYRKGGAVEQINVQPTVVVVVE